MAMREMDPNGGTLSWIVSFGVFIFFALTLSAPSGYSYGAALLFLSSLFFLWRRPRLDLSTEDKTLAYIFLAITLVALVIFWLHGDPPKTIDQTSRYILAIPVLFLLLKVPPRLSWLWAGLIAGAVSSAAITLWQRHWQGIARATGFVTSAIPYGDIGLMLGILCGAGLFWTIALRRHVWPWRIALLLGVLAGFYSFIASETRGGWAAVPAVAALFCIAFARKPGKLIAAGAVCLVAAAILFALGPETGMKERFHEAVKEVQMYRQSGNADTSVGARLEAWRTALINIPAKPLLGWSYKDYQAEIQRQAVERKIDPYVLSLSNTHNNYLEVWLHQGLLGLVSLLALYAYSFWSFCRRLTRPGIAVRSLAAAGSSLVASFFLFGMTQVILGRNNGVIFFVLTLTILWACLRHEEGKQRSG